MQGRLDRVAATRLHLVRVEVVGADVLQLAQVRVTVLLGSRRRRFRVAGGLDVDVVAQDGDDVAAEVLVVRREAAGGATSAAASAAADVLEILPKILR